MLDLKITGGKIIDGSGSIGFYGDIGVSGNKIDSIGDLSKLDAAQTFNAENLIVCPGFIDAHSHSDTYLLIEPAATSKITQGVTTEIVGNCGASAAPIKTLKNLPSDWQQQNYKTKWSSMADFLNLLEDAAPAVNVAALVGHGKIRAWVMDYADRLPDKHETQEMAKLLDECLDAGAAGMSSGLIYPPGMFADQNEITELARRVAAHNGVYTSHMRNEGTRLLEALDEIIATGMAAGVKIEISHLKTSGKTSWHLIEPALEKIRTAIANGVIAGADRYPYTAGNTDLDVVLPDWAQEGGREKILNRLRDTKTRKQIINDLEASRPEEDWNDVMIGSTSHPDNRPFRGMSIIQTAHKLGISPCETIVRLIQTDNLATSAFFFGMNEDNMWKIISEPYIMIGSDASLRAPTGPLSHDHPHPRAYGTFPKVIRAAIAGKIAPLHETIRKATSLPASHFSLTGRGTLKSGYFADIVAFDPETINDNATWAEPHQIASGITHVIVNGTPTIIDSRQTGKRAGSILRHTA